MRVLIFIALAATLSASSGCERTPQTDLFEATATCDLAGVKAALAAKAGVNSRFDTGASPLMVASGDGCVGVVRELIADGADVNARISDPTSPSENGYTALMSASWSDGAEPSGHLEVVRALIAAGADVNAKTDGGQTALALAARYGQLEAAQALIAAGADVNAQERDGRTPLAEVTLKGADGNYANGTAKEHADLATFLRQHGGHANSPWDSEP